MSRPGIESQFPGPLANTLPTSEYIYIYMCVCVCVCVCAGGTRDLVVTVFGNRYS